MKQCPFSERFLQIIWNERLLRPQAKCTDRREIRILSVGLWNRLAGPDFQDAAVIIGDTLRRGDVEVHRWASEWHSHGHDRDSRYANVILHVVWQDGREESWLRRTTGNSYRERYGTYDPPSNNADNAL